MMSKIPLSEAEQLPKDILDAEGIDTAELKEAAVAESNYVEIAIKDARKAVEYILDSPTLSRAIKTKKIVTYGSNMFATDDTELFQELLDVLERSNIETLEVVSELDEISTTAGVPGYQTPYAFGKASDDTVNILGYKKVKKANKNVMNSESKFMQISKELHLHEVSYKDYKNDPTSSSKQKVNQAIHEVNKKMYQIEKIINQNLRLKNEMKLGNSEYWKSTNEKMYKISERLIRIAKNLKELNA